MAARKKIYAQAARISDMLTTLINKAFAERNQRDRFVWTPRGTGAWGDRALDCLTRARRALDEARRYGTR